MVSALQWFFLRYSGQREKSVTRCHVICAFEGRRRGFLKQAQKWMTMWENRVEQTSHFKIFFIVTQILLRGWPRVISFSGGRSMKHCQGRLSIWPQTPPCITNIHRSRSDSPVCRLPPRPNLLAKHTRTAVQTLIDLVKHRSFQPGRSACLTGIKKTRHPRLKTSKILPLLSAEGAGCRARVCLGKASPQ